MGAAICQITNKNDLLFSFTEGSVIAAFTEHFESNLKVEGKRTVCHCVEGNQSRSQPNDDEPIQIYVFKYFLCSSRMLKRHFLF